MAMVKATLPSGASRAGGSTSSSVPAQSASTETWGSFEELFDDDLVAEG